MESALEEVFGKKALKKALMNPEPAENPFGAVPIIPAGDQSSQMATLNPPPQDPLQAAQPPPGMELGKLSIPMPMQAGSRPMAEKLKALLEESPSGISDQKESVENMKVLMKKLAEASSSRMNLAPLNALTEKWTGIKFNDKYQPPPTPEEIPAQSAKLQDMILKGQHGFTEDEVNTLKAKLLADSKAEGGSPLDAMRAVYFGNRSGVGEDNPFNPDNQRAFTAHKGILDKLERDHVLTNRLNQAQNLTNAYKVAAGTKDMTQQQFNDLQQSIVRNMGLQSGGSGVGERAERYLRDAGMDLGTIKQYFTGVPVDVRSGSGKELLLHITQMAKAELHNIEKTYSSRLAALTAGWGSMYEKHPELKKDLEEAIHLFGSQLEGTGALDAAIREPKKKKEPTKKAGSQAVPTPSKSDKFQSPDEFFSK